MRNNNPILSCRIDHQDRVISAVCIRRPTIILLRQRIYRCKPADSTFIVSSRVVVHIQSMHHIQLLSVVLVRLLALFGSRTLCKRCPERIILRTLHHRCRCIGYDPVIAQMVVDVKVIISRFIIPSIDQYSFQDIVLVNDITYIVRGQGLGQCRRIDS